MLTVSDLQGRQVLATGGVDSLGSHQLPLTRWPPKLAFCLPWQVCSQICSLSVGECVEF